LGASGAGERKNLTKLPKELVARFIDVAAQDHEKADLMLQENPQLLNARWLRDASVLQHLAMELKADGVRFLLERGARVNAKDKFGNDALTEAAGLGNLEIAELLVEYGADVRAISDSFETPILAAVRSGNAKVVELLLSSGADPYYRSPIGKTIFDVLPAKNSERRAVYRVLEKFAPKPRK
jgi:ankyrin repeat protein